jgi:hypothetical protein
MVVRSRDRHNRRYRRRYLLLDTCWLLSQRRMAQPERCGVARADSDRIHA